MSSVLCLLCLLLLDAGALGFEIRKETFTHQKITENAILNTTVQLCRALAQADGTVFIFPAQPYTAEAVAAACNSPQSQKSFAEAIGFIQLRNARVDILHLLDAEYHFDSESFALGRKVITDGLKAVKASIKRNNFEAARGKLGDILHSLQDFYSHSNWVELGNKFPNPNLIRTDTNIGNLADQSRATCRNCNGDDCTNNILEDVIQEKILTSGYFKLTSGSKPKGKCSHGGPFDQTSKTEPIGGINKDKPTANHGFLHTDAANLATAATSQLLEDIRSAIGDRPFLQMLGITRGSNKVLCFVIDTTKSMSDDIDTVKSVTLSIITSKVGTANEPSLYILVTFNDPGFGLLIKTTDPQVFKDAINSLTASGGGDLPELSLSGLQLALSDAPLNSEIFLFTDAPAKDVNLFSTVIALIEQTKTVVNFLITASLVTNRVDVWEQQSSMTESEAQLYRDLAQASGGQAIEVTKGELPVASSIITESSTSSLVVLLQAARSPGVADNFFFIVDQTVTNLVVYITGSAVTFTLISPTGETQQSTGTTGSLITASQSVGNFRTLKLNKQVGQWQIKMVSTNPYTLKVIGQSPIDFLFTFVEASQDSFGGFDAIDRRPTAGVNGTLLVSVTGRASATVTEVALVESSSSVEIKGVVEPQGNNSFLVQFDMMPSVEFVVRMKGQDSSTPPVVFQRQSPTSFRTSNITVTANPDDILVPGTPFTVPFTVTSRGRGGNFTIRATNNQNRFNSTSPASLVLEAGGSVNGTVNISAPLNTPSGTEVTLTIEAEAPEGTDLNYIVLRISVVNTVTDFTPPACQLLSLQSNCSKNCSLSSWALSVQVTDGTNGTGVDHVSLTQGSGTMITSPAPGNENTTLVSYSASCCSPVMELLAVDRVGNEGSCRYSDANFLTTQSPLLYLSLLLLGQILTKVDLQ